MKKASLVLSFLLVFYLFSFISGTRASANNNRIMVGVFYYPWYFHGNGTGHWNGNATAADPGLPYSWWTVVDIPVDKVGNDDWYASDSETLIKRQLDWFNYSGIDFGIISWWGPNSNEDNCTKKLFNVTESYAKWFKWVISVEGYREGYDDYNFTEIRRYINETYATPYDDIWLHYNNRPLLCWMTAHDMTGTTDDPKPQNIQNITSDPLFEPRIIGQDSYVNWTSWRPYRGCNITSIYPPSMNEFVCVMPRYDETRLDPLQKTPGSPRNIMCDPHLDGSDGEHVEPLNGEPLYDKQWSQVIQYAHNTTISFVAIATWNDFTERTQIEPCNDSTSAYKDNVFFLLNKTKHYISILKDTEAPTISKPFQDPSENVTEDQNVTISVNVSDYGSGVNRVLLNWTTNVTYNWSSVLMASNSGTGLYEGVIPGQKAGTSVNYSITAYDDANNCRVDDNQTYYYNYAVTPEFSPLLVFPLFMLATLAAVIVYKRKRTHSAQRQNHAG